MLCHKFPKFEKIHGYTNLRISAQSNWTNPKRPTERHIIIKLLNAIHERRILESCKRKVTKDPQ